VLPGDFIDAFPVSTMTQKEVFAGANFEEKSAKPLQLRPVVTDAIGDSWARAMIVGLLEFR
jgi:hypothetical protein